MPQLQNTWTDTVTTGLGRMPLHAAPDRKKLVQSRTYMDGDLMKCAPTGTLKDFEYTDRLGEIQIPSLICSGISDLCSPLVAKTLADGIPNSKWILWENARHTCFVDRHDDYCKELIKWMNHYD